MSRVEALLNFLDHKLRARRQSTPAVHIDAFAVGDEFVAALESCRTQFELCDGVGLLVRVPLDNEESIREP